MNDIKFSKENKIKKLLSFDIGKSGAVILLVIGLAFIFSASEDDFFRTITGIGIIILSVISLIFL